MLSLLVSLSALAGPLLVQTGDELPGAPDEWDDLDPIDLVDEDGHPIINGEVADADLYPMTGGVIFDGTLDFGAYGQQHWHTLMCSSTLIAPDVVALAAHCVDPDVLTYGWGTVEGADYRWSRQADLTDQENASSFPADAVAAWDWVTHPDWRYEQLQTGLARNYDIALLFLDEPVQDVPVAYLPTPDEVDQVQVGAEVDVVGWGQSTAASSPPPGTYGIKRWGTSYISKLDTWEFQVGEVTQDVRKCHGDSGGPSFMEVETDSPVTWRMVGITSHAYDSTDCRQTGGVDTRVDAYLEWIDDEMRARCEDGSRAWCDTEGILPPPRPRPDLPGFEFTLGGCSAAPLPAVGFGWLLALVPVAVRRRR